MKGPALGVPLWGSHVKGPALGVLHPPTSRCCVPDQHNPEALGGTGARAPAGPPWQRRGPPGPHCSSSSSSSSGSFLRVKKPSWGEGEDGGDEGQGSCPPPRPGPPVTFQRQKMMRPRSSSPPRTLPTRIQSDTGTRLARMISSTTCKPHGGHGGVPQPRAPTVGVWGCGGVPQPRTPTQGSGGSPPPCAAPPPPAPARGCPGRPARRC